MCSGCLGQAAIRRASSGSVFAFSASLVQRAVQPSFWLVVSSLVSTDRTVVGLHGMQEVSGSTPLSSTTQSHKPQRFLAFVVSNLYRMFALNRLDLYSEWGEMRRYD